MGSPVAPGTTTLAHEVVSHAEERGEAGIPLELKTDPFGLQVPSEKVFGVGLEGPVIPSEVLGLLWESFVVRVAKEVDLGVDLPSLLAAPPFLAPNGSVWPTCSYGPGPMYGFSGSDRTSIGLDFYTAGQPSFEWLKG